MAITAGLSAWLGLDETSGDALDSYGSLTLTDVNGCGTGAGVMGTARTFDKTLAQRFTRASGPETQVADEDLSLTAWVKFATVPGAGNYPGIVGKWDNATPSCEYLLYFDGDLQRFRWVVSGDGSTNSTVDANVLGVPSASVWYFLSAWHDATNDEIGIRVNNGALWDVTPHLTGVYSGTATFSVGSPDNAFSSSTCWDGSIDTVTFKRRLLTTGDEGALYNGGAGCTLAEAIVQSTPGCAADMALFPKSFMRPAV